MEILNQQIVEIPIKAILILLLLKAITWTLNSAKADLKDNKGWKGIVDEIVQLAIEIALIVALLALPLNTWVGPIASVIGFIVKVVLEFIRSLPGILK